MIGNNDNQVNQIDSSKADDMIEESDPNKRSTDEDSSAQPVGFSMGVSNSDALLVEVSDLSNADIIRKGLQYAESLELEKAV